MQKKVATEPTIGHSSDLLAPWRKMPNVLMHTTVSQSVTLLSLSYKHWVKLADESLMVPVLQTGHELRALGLSDSFRSVKGLHPLCPTLRPRPPNLSPWFKHEGGGPEGPGSAKVHADRWAELGVECREDMVPVCPDQTGTRSLGEKRD